MSLLNDKFDFRTSNSSIEGSTTEKNDSKVENIEEEKGKIERLNGETLVMDPKNIQSLLTQFKYASYRHDNERIDLIKEELSEILSYLGKDTKETLEIQKSRLTTIKEKAENNELINAQCRNCDAKLSVIGYKPVIEEIVGDYMRNEVNNNKTNNDSRKLSKKVLFGGILGLAGVIAIGAAIKSCDKDKFTRTVVTTNTGIESTTDNTTTLMEETSTKEATVSTGDYSMETGNTVESIPSRETTTSTTEESNKDNNKKKKTTSTKQTKRTIKPTIKKIRSTSPKNRVVVIKKSTPIPTKKPVQTGSNTIPKPTKKTLSLDELKSGNKVSKNERIENNSVTKPKTLTYTLNIKRL